MLWFKLNVYFADTPGRNQISADCRYIESICRIQKVQICKNITTLSDCRLQMTNIQKIIPSKIVDFVPDGVIWED